MNVNCMNACQRVPLVIETFMSSIVLQSIKFTELYNNKL